LVGVALIDHPASVAVESLNLGSNGGPRKFAKRGHGRARIVDRRSVAYEYEKAVTQKANPTEREYQSHEKQSEWVNPLSD